MKFLSILISFIFIIGFIILIVIFVLNPLFFVSKLSLNETIDILEKKECGYFSHRFIRNNNKFQIDNILVNSSEYEVIGLSVNDKSKKIFNVKVNTHNNLFRKREIIVKEIS